MYDVTAPGRNLHGKFVALGNMTGKTSDEIIADVGNPTSISSMARGQTLLQWQATGCHMAILFGPDSKFIKITHQYAKYAPHAPEPRVRYVPQRSGIGTVIGVIFGIVMALGIFSRHC